MAAISEINVTPLIDLAFALLIIFMITTPLLEQTIPLQLPLESQSPQPSRSEEAFETISIRQDATIFWGDRSVTLARLDEILANAATSANPPVISIRADRRLPYQKVIEVLDLVKQNELTRISLDTQVK